MRVIARDRLVYLSKIIVSFVSTIVVVFLFVVTASAIELQISDKSFVNSFDIMSYKDDFASWVIEEKVFTGDYNALLIEGMLSLGNDSFCSDGYTPIFTFEDISPGEDPVLDDFPADDVIRRVFLGIYYAPKSGKIRVSSHGYPGRPRKGEKLRKLYLEQDFPSLDVTDEVLRCDEDGENELVKLIDFKLYVNAGNSIISLKAHGAPAAQTYFTSLSYGYGERLDRILYEGISPDRDAFPRMDVYWRVVDVAIGDGDLRASMPSWSVYQIKWRDVLSEINREWGAKAYPVRKPTLEEGAHAAAIISPTTSITLPHF